MQSTKKKIKKIKIERKRESFDRMQLRKDEEATYTFEKLTAG